METRESPGKAPGRDGARREAISRSSERGVGVLATLLVILIISVLGSSMMLSGTTDVATSDNYRASKAALYEADSGLQQTVVDFLNDPSWVTAAVNPTLPVTPISPFPSTLTVNGHTLTVALNGGNLVPDYYAFGGTVALGNGTYTRSVFLPPTNFQIANGKGSKAWMTFPMRAIGTAGGAEPSTQRVQADGRVMVHRVAIWDNAIFAGVGQAGQQISGNVEVRGSMHVVGDPNNPTLLDWTGGAGVRNNYDLASDSKNFGADAFRLPPLPQRMFNGELVDTLDAEVRVNHGTVQLDGSVTMGETDVAGDGNKETLDGVYTENPVVFTSGSAAVHAEEVSDYDISVNVPFPTLDDPYTSPRTGTTYAHHRDFLNTEAMTLAVNAIDDTTPSFALADGQGNSIAWDLATQTLDVQGIVRVDGDLQIGFSGGGNRRLNYRGTGTLYATDDIEIDWDIVPDGQYLDTGQPTVHNLGLIAEDDMMIATTSQLEIFAAIYAEDEMVFGKQTRIAGATVASYFDMGTDVPRIWQTPALSGMLPPGMPGAGPLLFPNRVDLSNWTQLR